MHRVETKPKVLASNILVMAAVLSWAVPESSSAQEDVRCALEKRPAATLLLPYFEVDLEDPNGRNTLFSVANVHSEPMLVHAVVWNNWSRPVLAFDVFIAGRGQRTFDVRRLISGRLPSSDLPSGLPSGTYRGCSDPLTLPDVDATAVMAQLSGRPHPEDGMCYSGPVEGGRLATGYVTVDVVRDCSGAAMSTSNDPGYYEDGGGGLATHQNVLVGDFFLVDPANDFAQGEGLVMLAADAQRFGPPIVCVQPPCPERVPSALHSLSNRMPLAKSVRARFLRGGGFVGETDVLVWIHRSSGAPASPSACGEARIVSSHVTVLVEARDEAGASVGSYAFETEADSFRVGVGSELLPVAARFGTIDVRASETGHLVPSTYDAQIWVMPLVKAEGRYSAGVEAAVLEDFCGAGTSQ